MTRAVAVTVIAAAVALAPAYLAGRAIDDVVAPEDLSQLTWLCALLVAVTLIRWAANVYKTVVIARLGRETLARLRVRVFDHFHRLPLSYFDRTPSSIPITRITTDVETLDRFLRAGIPILTTGLLTMAATVVVVVGLDARLGIVPILALPLVIVTTAYLGRRSSREYQDVTENTATLTAGIDEVLAGAQTIRCFAQEPEHQHALATVNAGLKRSLNHVGGGHRHLLVLIELVAAAATGAVVIWGGHQVLNGALSIGILVSFITYMRAAIAPLPALSGLYNLYAQSIAGLDKIVELLAIEPAAESDSGSAFTEPGPVDLTLREVTFGYRGGQEVLRDLDLTLRAGHVTAFVGPTGAGKSTIVKLILGLYEPTTGRIEIAGVDRRDIDARTWQRRIGYVPQDPFLFRGTVAENIAFTQPDATRTDVEAAVIRSGLTSMVERLPTGLDTVVTDRGENLSSGQRQLVALARALFSDPQLLILDEATSSLDRESEALIRATSFKSSQSAINSGRGTRTVVIIAHSLASVRDADDIFVVQSGQIVERGDHDFLISAGGTYAELVAASPAGFPD